MSFREAASRIEGDDFAARVARMSALAAAEKFEPTQPAPFMRVDFLEGVPDAYALGRTIEQVHTATAHVAKWIRNPTGSKDVGRADRERVPLRPRAHGSTIFFDFPDTTAGPDMLFGGRTETLAEVAAFQMIERLPQSAEDDATLDALLSEPDPIKRAIDRLASAAVAASGIGLQVSTREHRGEQALITSDQGRVLNENLNLPVQTVETKVVRGTLDGMRTRRRLFYLISGADDHEIAGAVADDMLLEVREHIGELVEAAIETTVITTPTGRTRAANRLLSVHSLPTLSGE